MMRGTAPYACVIALQFFLLYPLHATMDLPLWDEVYYMGLGESFLRGGSLGPVSGSPVYALLYSLSVKLFGTIDGVLYMQYFVKISVSALLLLLLTERLKSRLLAVLLTLIWVVSGVNIWETVLVYHVALGIFLLAVVSSSRNRILTLLLLCLCSLTRLEYLFPTLAYGGYLLFTTLRGRRNVQPQPRSPRGTLTPRGLVAFLAAVLLSYVALNIEGWNPGSKRAWFAFNQNYARHEVEAGRYDLDPYVDSNVVIQRDFPGADSLTEAFLINPGAVSKQLSRNLLGLPRAVLSFGFPYTYLRRTYGLMGGALLGFGLTIFLYAAANDRRQLLSGLRRLAGEHEEVLHLTLISALALVPGLFVYPLAHYTLIMAPFCLLWLGLVCLRVLEVINSSEFTRWALTAMTSLFILCILVTTRPYASQGQGRPVFEQVTQLAGMWPEERIKIIGVGATSYATYIGSQKAQGVEPLGTVYGEKIESGSDDLRVLIERHAPDAVLVTRRWLDSKNFDASSLDALDSERWVRCPVGSDSVYFLREKFVRCR